MKLYDITGRHLQFRDALTLGLGVRYADQIMLLHRDRYYCDSIPDYSPIAHTLEVKYQSEAIRRIFYICLGTILQRTIHAVSNLAGSIRYTETIDYPLDLPVKPIYRVYLLLGNVHPFSDARFLLKISCSYRY